MATARHPSVSVHIGCQETDMVNIWFHTTAKSTYAENQASMRQMSKVVGEQRCQIFEAEMDAQNNRNKLRAKGEGLAGMLEALQKREAWKEERERTVDNYETRISYIENLYV